MEAFFDPAVLGTVPPSFCSYHAVRPGLSCPIFYSWAFPLDSPFCSVSPVIPFLSFYIILLDCFLRHFTA